jgi:hypothetical protein
MAGAFGSGRTGRPQDMAGKAYQDANTGPGRPQDTASPTLGDLQARLACPGWPGRPQDAPRTPRFIQSSGRGGASCLVGDG